MRVSPRLPDTTDIGRLVMGKLFHEHIFEAFLSAVSVFIPVFIGGSIGLLILFQHLNHPTSSPNVRKDAIKILETPQFNFTRGDLTKDQQKLWDKWIVSLKKYVRTEHPVQIIFKAPPGDESFGTCHLVDGDHFEILIDPKLDFVGKQQTLIHEYAHVEAYFTDDTEYRHGLMWGLAYSRCYRAVVYGDLWEEE